jgi:hypothetical protein
MGGVVSGDDVEAAGVLMRDFWWLVLETPRDNV